MKTEFWGLLDIATGQLIRSRVAAAPHLYLTKGVAESNARHYTRRTFAHPQGLKVVAITLNVHHETR